MGPNFIGKRFPQIPLSEIFDNSCTEKSVTGFNWIALNGSDKGIKKDYEKIRYIKRDQLVTCIVENKALANPYTEYNASCILINHSQIS